MGKLQELAKEFNGQISKNVDLSLNTYLVIKRILDIILSIIGIFLSTPIMLIVIILIKLESPGSALFKQIRVGRGGENFIIYKLRSMVQDAEEETGAVWARKNDCRVTRVGKFIRETRIDELPQFFNVLQGNMTIVGPRPERPIFTEHFEQEYSGFKQRLLVKPGITGLAQVKGGYDLNPGQKLRLDMIYIRKRCLLLDLEIMVRTVIVVVFGYGAR